MEDKMGTSDPIITLMEDKVRQLLEPRLYETNREVLKFLQNTFAVPDKEISAELRAQVIRIMEKQSVEILSGLRKDLMDP